MVGGWLLKTASNGAILAPKRSLFFADTEGEIRETRAPNPNWKAYLIAARGAGLNLKCRIFPVRCSSALNLLRRVTDVDTVAE